MDPAIRFILHNTQAEQLKVTIFSSAGSFCGLIRNIEDQLVELQQEDGKRCWIVTTTIQAIREQ